MSRNKNNDNLIQSLDTSFKYFIDILVMLLPLFAVSVYLYGVNALRVAFFSVAPTTVVQEIISRITKSNRKLNNLFAFVTSLSVALMLPATVPTYIAVIGGLFALLAAIVPFGSARKVPFVPACVGFAFLCVCFPTEVFTYSELSIGQTSSIYGTQGFISSASFGEMLTYGKSVSLNALENISILIGNNPGPMGTTSVLILLSIGAYLLIRRKDRFLISLSYIVACGAMALLFPRVNSGHLTSLIMELSSGTLLFTAFVLLPNPSTSPVKSPQTLLYGFSAGLITMLLRYYGKYQESACFAVLLMNAILPVVEDWSQIVYKSVKDKKVSQNNEKPKKTGVLSNVKQITDKKNKRDNNVIPHNEVSKDHLDFPQKNKNNKNNKNKKSKSNIKDKTEVDFEKDTSLSKKSETIAEKTDILPEFITNKKEKAKEKSENSDTKSIIESELDFTSDIENLDVSQLLKDIVKSVENETTQIEEGGIENA